MKQLLEQGIVEELKTLQNVAYLLKDSSAFSITAYKVLKAQDKSLVKCQKLLYNGNIKLVYFTRKYKTLKNGLHMLEDNRDALVIIAKLIDAVDRIRNNGFLLRQCIDLSLERIFLDINTFEVKLIYLPVNIEGKAVDTFDCDFRRFILDAMSECLQFPSSVEKRMRNIIDDEKLTMDELSRSLLAESKSMDVSEETKEQAKGESKKEPRIESVINTILLKSSEVEKPKPQPVLLVELQQKQGDARQELVFEIDKSEFIIGKSVTADGVADFNKAISRKHCQISYHDNNYYIKDLGSVNGTYLNREKLVVGREYSVEPGDIIRLANSNFILHIREV